MVARSFFLFQLLAGLRIMLVMAKEMKEGRLIESPIYIEGMISEASAIHMSYAHYLGSDVRKSVSQGINPFQSEYFTVISGYGKRDDILTVTKIPQS